MPGLSSSRLCRVAAQATDEQQLCCHHCIMCCSAAAAAAFAFAAFNADPKTGQEVRGICSNYLADVKPGDELVMTGPAGTALLLADNPWKKRIVCVSTGALPGVAVHYLVDAAALCRPLQCILVHV